MKEIIGLNCSKCKILIIKIRRQFDEEANVHFTYFEKRPPLLLRNICGYIFR